MMNPSFTIDSSQSCFLVVFSGVLQFSEQVTMNQASLQNQAFLQSLAIELRGVLSTRVDIESHVQGAWNPRMAYSRSDSDLCPASVRFQMTGTLCGQGVLRFKFSQC